MSNSNKNNLYIRILEFGEANPKGFTYHEMIDYIKPENWEEKIIKEYIENAVKNYKHLDATNGGNLKESIFFMTGIENGAIEPQSKIEYILQIATFIIKYDAYFNYIDFKELTEALRSSKEAKNLALWAIGIAVITGIIQTIVGILQIYLTK